MIRLGRLVGLDLKMRVGPGQLPPEGPISLKVNPRRMELSGLVQAFNEGEEFMVVLEPLETQPSLLSPPQEVESHD